MSHRAASCAAGPRIPLSVGSTSTRHPPRSYRGKPHRMQAKVWRNRTARPGEILHAWSRPSTCSRASSATRSSSGLSASAPTARRTCPRGRLRPLGEPRLELRPVAAGHAALAGAAAAVHGEGRALPLPALADPEGGRCLQRPPRRGRRGGDADGGRARPRGRGGRDLPGGHAPREGARQEVRGEAAHGRGPRRARGGRAARPGGDRRHRQPDEARPPPRRLRGADRPRRPPRPRDEGRGPRGDRPPDDCDPRARERPVRPLLVVDGDSLAHRAYHALPKTIRRKDDHPAGAIVGFGNMLLRLWDTEQPRAVLVGWDTLSVPTYRHEAFPTYHSGRAPVLVVTSDRDAYQLASERCPILAPARGASELNRIGPAEVRERYGVEPEQVPDFIALRGDPSDRLPGAPVV